MAQVTELERLTANLQVLEELRTRLVASGQQHLVPDWAEKEQVLEGMRARAHELENPKYKYGDKVFDTRDECEEHLWTLLHPTAIQWYVERFGPTDGRRHLLEYVFGFPCIPLEYETSPLEFEMEELAGIWLGRFPAPPEGDAS